MECELYMGGHSWEAVHSRTPAQIVQDDVRSVCVCAQKLQTDNGDDDAVVC